MDNHVERGLDKGLRLRKNPEKPSTRVSVAFLRSVSPGYEARLLKWDKQILPKFFNPFQSHVFYEVHHITPKENSLHSYNSSLPYDLEGMRSISFARLLPVVWVVTASVGDPGKIEIV
ncbi:hypothetical protein STEG23_004537 [Scotinomys teguina]